VNSNALDAWGVGSAFGTAIGSGYGSNGNIYTRYSNSGSATVASESAPTRFNGAIRYISPAFNGFTASALIVPKKTDTDTQSVTDIGVKYNNGPLNVAFASQEVKETGTTATDFVRGLGANEKSKLNILSANYTMGAATLLGGYWTEKLVNAAGVNTTDAKGYMIGGKYVIGAVTLIANYGKNDDKLVAAVDKKITGIGADYALSKRTALYARFDKRTSVGAEDITRTAVGVRHTF
jgi:predicted porin